MVKIIFCALLGNFVLILSQFFIPIVRDLFKGSLFFLLPFATFFLLGAILTLLTIKKKIKGRLKKFLILTGASASGFFLSVLLHNFLYGLSIITKPIALLSYLLKIFHAIFFIIAIFACPIGLFIGIVGSLLFFHKKRKQSLSS